MVSDVTSRVYRRFLLLGIKFSTSAVTTNENFIADQISCVILETNSIRDFPSIVQDYPELRVCKCFQPSSELILLVMDTILQKKLINLMEVNRVVLKTPGQIIS